mgnify:CR=1 FL=1
MEPILYALIQLDEERKNNPSIHVLRAINMIEKAFPMYKVDKMEA